MQFQSKKKLRQAKDQYPIWGHLRLIIEEELIFWALLGNKQVHMKERQEIVSALVESKMPVSFEKTGNYFTLFM